MVIGNGLVATALAAFRERDDVLIFASGCSNSKGNDPAAFARETAMVQDALKLARRRSSLFVYFGTASVYDPEESRSAYALHKLRVEEIVETSGADWLVFRVSQLVGPSRNKNTLVNFLIDATLCGKPFDLWARAERNLLDADDFARLVQAVIDDGALRRRVVNLATPRSLPVTTIVAEIERFLGRKANFRLVDKGGSCAIDISDVEPYMRALGLEYDDRYLGRMLRKHFPDALEQGRGASM